MKPTKKTQNQLSKQNFKLNTSFKNKILQRLLFLYIVVVSFFIIMSKCNIKTLHDVGSCRQVTSRHSCHYNDAYKQKVSQVTCNKCGNMAFYHDEELINENNIEIREEKEVKQSYWDNTDDLTLEDIGMMRIDEEENGRSIFSGTGELLI